ncbi:putative ribonuclease H-like domain-containing protein [Tanacetum coccineum]
MPPKYDLVLTDEGEYLFSELVTSIPNIATREAKTCVSKPKSVSEPLIEDWIFESEDENEIEFKSKQRKPSFAKTEFVKSNEHVKTPKESIKKVENKRQAKYPRKNSQIPRDYDLYEKKMLDKTIWNNARKANHQNSQRMTHPHPKGNFVPKAVLIKSGIKTFNTAGQNFLKAAVSVNSARPINTAYPRPTVNIARTSSNVFNREHTHVRRTFNKSTTNKNGNLKEKVNTVKRDITTAGPKAVVSDNKGNKANAVKATTCWVWRPKQKVLDHGNPQLELQEKGVIDSGCFRHMTGNMSYLLDYKEIDGGFVAFGGDPKGGRITGNGKISTGKLDFEDVYFVKELKFNLFSVSQMCDKKNNVLFTNTECVVLSPDFKLLDENHVLLRVPRKDNMYSVDLKNIVPSGGLTCLFAKATLDESNLWHRRLGHINFKTLNKLVRGNLVRGLPSKIFENNHTCVACQKGKQHKASCKTKTVSSISQPLQMLHMDLFGPTFVKSLMKKVYCLVVTDDYSRFSWVFFLATKDETSEILKTFITGIENLIDLKVKVIRCDNGTEFKNKVMNQFCEMKGIKREFSVARTPQQNGVAERKNRTLIEAARTMLADLKLPTTFLAEAVNTACYVQNRMLVIKPHNKTPYELFLGRKPALSFMRLFGCPVTILNTLDHLGKFDGKANEWFFVGYSTNSKAYRVFNNRTRIVKENLHVKFSEETHNIAGNGPNWLFDIDALTISMNYKTVVVGNQTNGNAGTKENINDSPDAGFKPSGEEEKIDSKRQENEDSEVPNIQELRVNQEQDANVNITNNINTVNLTPNLEEIVYSDDDDDEVGAEADMNNLATNVTVSPIPSTRVHTDHPLEQIIVDIHSAPQTKRMTKNVTEHVEPKKVYKNKKDDRGIMVRNKARLVAQGYTQEEGIDYDDVFALVARIEAFRLFLAYASFMRFIVNQMDVKSAFLYGTIEEEVYLCQPPASYKTLSTYLLENGFRRGTIDKTLFIKKDKGDILLVHVYVDDIIFGSTKKSLCVEFEQMMHKRFQMSSIGELTFFLGLPVKQKDDGIFIRLQLRLTRHCSRMNKLRMWMYRSMIRSLMYLTASRPDIMFAVCACARDSPFDLEAFSDSNYAGASLDRKFTTGGCQFLGKRLISWQCKKQTIVANSTTKAEYVAAANCYRQEWEDRMERAATTASSLVAEQDSGNINRTQSMATLNESFPQGTDSGSGPRCQDTILGGAEAQIRFEAASKQSNDPPLSRVNTLGINAAQLKLNAEKPEESDGFEEIIDFLNASYVQYALTVNPTIYTTCIEQFWASAKAKIFNGERQIQALVDKKKVIITKTSIRSDVKLDDAEGINCLPTVTIFCRTGNNGTTAWNEFSSTMASAIIFLATNQTFNFSKYIFDNMVKHLEGGVKFLMYPRFVQVFLDKQVEGMIRHKEVYVTPSHTKKVFANMKRSGKCFSRRVIPLFLTMMIQASKDMGEDSATPSDSHSTPIISHPSSSKPQKKKSKKKQRKESGLTEPVTNEAHKVLDLEKAKTAQAKEIASLKKRVIQLEKRMKLRTSRLKRLRKGRKIADLDADAEVTLVDEIQEINDDNMMFDTDVLEEQEKEVVEKEVSTADPVTTAGEVVTTANVEATIANAPTTTIDELNLAQNLIEIKASKPKVVTSAATTTTTTRPKARGVVVQEPSEFKTTSSALQASQLQQAKDKGKEIMVEPERPLKKKDQVALDEEMARNLKAQMQAELIKEERLARQKEEDDNIALIESWDNTQAMMEVNFELAQRLQVEEQGEITIEERSRLFVELINRRKKHFAKLRAKEIRRKPPTKA